MNTSRSLATALVVALTTGCGVVSDRAVSQEPWGERAVAWWHAMGTASAEGPEHLARFVDADLLWEDRVTGQVVHGEGAWIEEQISPWGRFLPLGEHELFVSANGMLSRLAIPMGPPSSYLDRLVIGPDGMSSWIRAVSIADASTVLAAPGHGPHSGSRSERPPGVDDAYEDLAERYVSLWNGSADLDAIDVYAADAVVMDTLLGESTSGPAAIDLSIGAGWWPSFGRISILDLAEEGVRAIYLAPSDGERMGPEELRLVIEVVDGSGCPGSMAVSLGLHLDRVTWERRYHRIESVRCRYDEASLRPGWWERIEIPSNLFVERTGTFSYGNIDVEVFNGTPELNRFLDWGFSRFEAAGLPLPRVSSVTFLRARVTCYNLGGRASPADDETSITLCRRHEDICRDGVCDEFVARSQQLWLHELAHAWLNDHVDEATRVAFLEFVGLARWADADDPWRRRGVECAADTVASGLMDESVELGLGYRPNCTAGATGFRMLTGVDPIRNQDPGSTATGRGHGQDPDAAETRTTSRTSLGRDRHEF